MKLYNTLSIAVISVFGFGFMSCEQNVAMETILLENGSVSRRIILQEVDSASSNENMFGVNQEAGWEVEMARIGKNKFDITFEKTFPSVEAMNTEMNQEDDGRFRVRSELTSRFRWFYTYHRYSDTFISLNRMQGVDQEHYFTREDYLFIDRLPAEGKPISRADSFFLAKLNDRIYEDFASRGYYEENFSALVKALEVTGAPPQWKDSLMQRKEEYYNELIKSEDFDDENFPLILERMNAPLDMVALRRAHKELTRDFERRVDFMSKAASTRMLHSVQLPWKITDTNADSIAYNRAFWMPPVVKFVLKDHTMFVEGRSFNVWAGIVSAVVVLITILLFTKRKSVFYRFGGG